MAATVKPPAGNDTFGMIARTTSRQSAASGAGGRSSPEGKKSKLRIFKRSIRPSTADGPSLPSPSVGKRKAAASPSRPKTAGAEPHKPDSSKGLTFKASSLAPARILGAVSDDWPMYSSRASDYELGEPIGYGASSVVYITHFKPLNRNCAVKVIDVDRLGGGDIERLWGETQLMSLAKHPNVLRVRGQWSQGSKLYIAVRLMARGSLLDIMRYAHPDGFSEDVIATVLKQALEGIHCTYRDPALPISKELERIQTDLHGNGWIHRDIKAANLLVDDDGTVLLADFGVSTTPRDEFEPDAPKRKSFVGTPCWMAPEVVEQREYNNKADIWSFGITALELAQGRAPHSLFPPARALYKTVSEAPPTLELSRPGSRHRYSKYMQSFVAMCLRKEPSSRPSAAELLSHPFFDKAKRKDYLIRSILSALPPLTERQERRKTDGESVWSTSRRGGPETGWDFATTVGKGGQVVLRWNDTDGSVYSAEGFSRGERMEGRTCGHSRAHSQSGDVGAGGMQTEPRDNDKRAEAPISTPDSPKEFQAPKATLPIGDVSENDSSSIAPMPPAASTGSATREPEIPPPPESLHRLAAGENTDGAGTTPQVGSAEGLGDRHASIAQPGDLTVKSKARARWSKLIGKKPKM